MVFGPMRELKRSCSRDRPWPPPLRALVPLTFTDVSGRVLVGYMVFTDFRTCCQWESQAAFSSQGRAAYFSTLMLIRGTPNSVRSTLVASTWSCKCKAAGNITAYGAAFVAIAVVAVITGVTLEFVVKNKVEENKRAAELKVRSRGGDREYGEYFWSATARALSATATNVASLC